MAESQDQLVESLSDALSALLVAEWKAHHTEWLNPQGQLTVKNEMPIPPSAYKTQWREASQ